MPAKEIQGLVRLHLSTLHSSHLDTDLIAVFRRPNAMNWWFWVWNGGEWRSVDWDDLVCNEKMDIVRRFYAQYDNLVDLHVPWKDERGLEVLVALESA